MPLIGWRVAEMPTRRWTIIRETPAAQRPQPRPPSGASQCPATCSLTADGHGAGRYGDGDVSNEIDADLQHQHAAHLYLPGGQPDAFTVTYADFDPDPRPHTFTNPHSISYGTAFCLLPYRHRRLVWRDRCNDGTPS